jgi:mRNA interferase MazF
MHAHGGIGSRAAPTYSHYGPMQHQPPARPTPEVSQGDLFWVTPDEDRGSLPAIAHPHVVVQDDALNRSRLTTVVLCALTTNQRRASEPGNVLLDPGEGNLPQASVVIVSQVSSVEQSRLGERIGTLSRHRVEQILDGMRFQQASFFAR